MSLNLPIIIGIVCLVIAIIVIGFLALRMRRSQAQPVNQWDNNFVGQNQFGGYGNFPNNSFPDSPPMNGIGGAGQQATQVITEDFNSQVDSSGNQPPWNAPPEQFEDRLEQLNRDAAPLQHTVEAPLFPDDPAPQDAPAVDDAPPWESTDWRPATERAFEDESSPTTPSAPSYESQTWQATPPNPPSASPFPSQPQEDPEEYIHTQLHTDHDIDQMRGVESPIAPPKVIAHIKLQGQEHPLTTQGAIIGRSKNSDIIVREDRKVSGKHIRLEVQPNRRVRLHVVSQTNPAVINGEILKQGESQLLEPEDEVRLSPDTQFVFIQRPGDLVD